MRKSAKKELERTPKKQVKILVVDDDEDLRDTFCEVMQDNGYNAVSAANAQEAIACVKDNGFTIIFMDIVLPDMNGVEAYKAIKKISPTAVTVMITGYAVEDLLNEAISEGVYGCLNKPFEIKKILKTINEITGKVESSGKKADN